MGWELAKSSSYFRESRQVQIWEKIESTVPSALTCGNMGNEGRDAMGRIHTTPLELPLTERWGEGGTEAKGEG